MNDIIIENISKAYNGRRVLENLSMTIKSGKTTCIMAPSGEGKTTLLRILMGLENADRGHITGMDGVRQSAVFQEDRLCESLSPIENIRLVTPMVTREQVSEALCSFGLSGCENKRISELSGGMKRRVAILRALMAQYDLLILDEPFKGLDLDTKTLVISEILRRTSDKTIILVTHDETEAKLIKACDIIRL
jgi:NitT/TauT family transport system ATP-binding protein